MTDTVLHCPQCHHPIPLSDSTVGMYGEMSGILGASMPEIPALTLEARLLESGDDA